MDARDYELADELRDRGHHEAAEALEEKLRDARVTPVDRLRRHFESVEEKHRATRVAET